jgi:hypothetical protein
MRYGVIAKTRAHRARHRGHPVEHGESETALAHECGSHAFHQFGSNAFDSLLMVTLADIV